jgi:hypothetical protein
VIKVYQAGPIAGQTDAECKDWRDKLRKEYSHIIEFLDPMKRDFRTIYGIDKEERSEGDHTNEIVDMDIWDINRCDIFMAYCPFPSVGTSMEIYHAHVVAKKPVVLVIPVGVRISPWHRRFSTKIVGTIDDAVAWIKTFVLET